MLERETDALLRRELPAILDVTDMAAFLEVSRLTVLREIAAGRIQAYKLDGAWNASRDDFLSYLDAAGNQ
jgi:excisionase family DNA binding protein